MKLNPTKTLLLGIAVITLLNSSCTTEKINIKQKSQFINFTDLHFNPFYDTTLVASLDKSDVNLWDSIFATSAHKSVSKYDEETNYFLLKSAFEAMHHKIEKPDFMIFTGDYICHDFGENYTKYSGNSNMDDMHKFLLKTITYITKQATTIFPEVLIIPTFGNNDSYCGDYHLQNNGEFLQDFSKLYKPILGNCLSTTEAVNFEKHGYYSIKSPLNTSLKIISLNSIYFSIKYQSDKYTWNCNCQNPKQNQDSIAQKELKWFEEQLADSKIKNEKVWIITHIPPGINVFNTIEKNTDKNNVKAVLYWNEKYNKQYLDLLETYSNQIFTTMTGHTHMDDFKLHNTNSSASYIHISPSVSPVFGNNPAFQIIDYNITQSKFTDYTTYFINIEDQQPTQWKKEYSFTETYPVKNLDAMAYDSLYTAMNTDSTYRLKYSHNFGVNSTHATIIDKTNWCWYNCGISSTLPVNFDNCVAQQ